MAAAARRLSPLDPLIVQSAQAYSLNPNLLRGILYQESSFNPALTGPVTHIGTAKGIAQLTPDTQAELGVKNPYDPQEAIPAAAALLAKYRQVAVDRGYQNPDAYAAMVYYGGPGFKPTNRPAPGVPGPTVEDYARSVVDHANAFAGVAGEAPDDDGVARLAMAGAGPAAPPRSAAGLGRLPDNAGAPDGAPVPAGPLPANWADVPGAPPSLPAAPPAAFTASSPEEQARWNQVSTPQGYAAALRELAAATSRRG